MIPKIITINDQDDADTIVADFASKWGIEPSHRIVLNPEKEELTVEQIHLMQKDIQVSFSKLVLVALRGVDASGVEVQNSLLKCLEEESERIQFLLLVKNPARLLSTILSRSSTVPGSPHTDVLPSTESALNIFSFNNNSESTKEEAVSKIDRYIQNSSFTNTKVLQHLLMMRKLIIDNNMNPLLALDNILIFLSKTSTMNVRNEKKQ